MSNTFPGHHQGSRETGDRAHRDSICTIRFLAD